MRMNPGQVSDLSKAAAPAWWVPAMAAMLAVSAASTKVAGLAFFVWLGWAVWFRLRRPAIAPADDLARAWLAVAVAVFVLRAGATAYWGDSWGSRHFEVRIALAGLIVWWLSPRLVLTERQRDALAHGLALGCWVAMAVTWIHGRETPTNPLPWAAGVSFMVCVLLMRVWSAVPAVPVRAWWLLSAWAGMGAVFLSDSRGSFGLFPWLVVASLWALAQLTNARAHGRRALAVLAGLGAVLVLTLSLQPRLYQQPLSRLVEAEQQFSQLAGAVAGGQVSAQAIDTSVGVRGYLYLRGAQAIAQAPLAGHGEAHRKAWVPALSSETGSKALAGLNHLHSDPLNIVFEHGLLGAASYLVLILGLVGLAWRARVHDGAMALGLAGLAWMHASSGLSNLNTIHNFYGVMLAMGVVLVFALGQRASTARV